jgi:hypothetical protein
MSPFSYRGCTGLLASPYDRGADHGVPGDAEHDQPAVPYEQPGRDDGVFRDIGGHDRRARRDPADERHPLVKCDEKLQSTISPEPCRRIGCSAPGKPPSR